jgi:hypothetical protein
MTDRTTSHPRGARRLLLVAGIAALISACGGAAATTTPTAAGTLPPTAPGTDALASAAARSAAATATATTEPEASGALAAGDVPDSAVFLAYRDQSHGFLVQYVEGWHVTPKPDGVTIADKDSYESVIVVTTPPDIAGFITGTDLPALQQQTGFKLVRHDRVTVGGHELEHLAFHLPAPPDPVTGKQVPSTVDRYYVPGSSGLAVVTLSTPDGVDNVDAFRQMIESFRWS